MQIMSKPKGGGRARPGSGITLKMLVDEGMLTPGVGVLSVEYKGSVTVADLLDDGRIWWKGACWLVMPYLHDVTTIACCFYVYSPSSLPSSSFV